MKRLTFLLLALGTFSLPAQAELVLRQATASQAVVIGPFVDSTDGNTAETALTIDAADVRISVNGGNIVGKTSGGCTHDELGYYACTFDATDTATVGRMQVVVHESGALPVYHEFSIVEEAVYDACCAASAAPLTATAVATELGTGTQFTAIPWNSSWDTEVQSEAADAINADTGDSFTAVPWNASWDAEVQSEATDALNAYDPPTAAELTSEVSGLLTSQRIITGTCDSGSTTTCVDSALTQADATQLEDRLICFDDQWCALITTFAPSTDTATTTKTAPSTRASKAYTIFPATVE